MAKAYQRKGLVTYTEYYCPNCEEWSTTDNWSEFQCIKYYEYNRWSFYDNDSDYLFEDGTGEEITVLRHDDCDEFFANGVDERDAGNWVCGECDTRHSDQEAARYCCT